MGMGCVLCRRALVFRRFPTSTSLLRISEGGVVTDGSQQVTDLTRRVTPSTWRGLRNRCRNLVVRIMDHRDRWKMRGVAREDTGTYLIPRQGRLDSVYPRPLST